MTHTITTKEGKLFVGTEQLVIPNFEIIEFVANGANGSVFKAIDTHLGRQVAVKIWNKRGKPRAQHEISKLALINHPLFGAVYKYDQHLNHPFRDYGVDRRPNGCSMAKDRAPIVKSHRGLEFVLERITPSVLFGATAW